MQNRTLVWMAKSTTSLFAITAVLIWPTRADRFDRFQSHVEFRLQERSSPDLQDCVYCGLLGGANMISADCSSRVFLDSVLGPSGKREGDGKKGTGVEGND